MQSFLQDTQIGSVLHICSCHIAYSGNILCYKKSTKIKIPGWHYRHFTISSKGAMFYMRINFVIVLPVTTRRLVCLWVFLCLLLLFGFCFVLVLGFFWCFVWGFFLQKYTCKYVVSSFILYCLKVLANLLRF